jgi:hypothetical protein
MPLPSDILDQLESMPAIVRDAATKISPQNYSRSPAKGDFSLVEHACHLRDLEREGYLVRIRRVLEEERPLLADFDGGKIAAERNYRAQDLDSAICDFEQCRSKAIGILRGLPDSQLDRCGEFAGVRTITLRDLVGMMIEHDSSHRHEIAALLAEIQP